MLSAFICGGNWNNGVNAGSRTVNLNNYPWNLNTNIGCRLACDLLMSVKCIIHKNRYGILRNIRAVVNNIFHIVYQIVFLVAYAAELNWLVPCGEPALYKGRYAI